MNKEELKQAFERFTDNNDFNLNPDREHIGFILNGLIENEKKFGLKLCPCRLRDGTIERDFELICPCNFKTQETWKTKGMCWCGLFVKK
ncbi:ferredoxin:thioredoxin reductase [Candidatus Woesearchaeota archaeon]|nr:ferredoxin:thioredoxin reductase [Candidatus Woesearchaeota archaeon]